MKNIVLLGASGSIGIQTLDVISKHPEHLNCIGISVGKNTTWLKEHLTNHTYQLVCIQDPLQVPFFESWFPNQVFTSGDEGLIQLACLKEADVFVNALVGFSGLIPTLKAIESKKAIALANKETLVVAGELVMKAVRENGVRLTPIDSEHSAIFQALQGNRIDNVERLIITASGGSFRNRSREELEFVTAKEALNHPNWSMGSKITIDSATMVNKAFEVIEAHWLFDLPYTKIETIIHEQSIIHSMVEYCDGSIMAQLGTPDMRVPIQYALLAPERLTLDSKRLDFKSLKALTFKEVNREFYPLFKRILEEAKKGGDRMVVVNAANEIAVDAFLKGKIPYLSIESLVMDALDHFPFKPELSLSFIRELDESVRSYTRSHI